MYVLGYEGDNLICFSKKESITIWLDYITDYKKNGSQENLQELG